MRRIHAVVASLSLLVAGPVLGQADTTPPSRAPAVERYQFTLDVGLLELGVGYGERLGAGPFSFGVGLWAAWEPPATFDRNFFEPRGVELFARYQISRALQAEAGPSFLRYAYADDCSRCGGTFLGVRVAAMTGRRVLFGPAVRFGRVTGGPARAEWGFVVGVQGRLLLDWEQ